MTAEKRYVLIGTAGHIDHGKTALVKMLTGCETDTLKEEKERGLTIDLGFAPCEMRGDLMACLVDVPGHEKFIRNMVAGASGIDAVLLVVAADDSVMPQTVEHLRIVELLGINRGLVAVTKIDMVDEELRELVVEEVGEFLEGTFLEGAPICPVSSITGEGMEGLWIALSEVVDSCTDRPVEGVFRMPVERVFSAPGFGTVTTGMPASGRLSVGDRLELLPQGQVGRLRGLQVYGKTSDTGWAGQCLALNVADIDHNSVLRGNVLATPGYLRAVKMVEVRLTMLPGAERPLKHQAPVRFHTGTAEVMGRIFHLDRDLLHPGESALVQFRAEEPIVVAPGDRFVIRQYSPVVTIGGGRVLRPSGRKVKRFREGPLEDLAALEDAIDDPSRLVEYVLTRAGTRPSRWEDLRTSTYLPGARLKEILAELAAEGRAVALGSTGEQYVATEVVSAAEVQVLSAVKAFHTGNSLRAGLALADLRQAVSTEPVILDAAVDRLVATGRLRREGPVLALPDHCSKMTSEQEAVAAKALRILSEAGVSPPEFKALVEALGSSEGVLRPVLDGLVDRGDAVCLSDTLYAHAEGEQAARRLLVDWIDEHGKIGVVDYRDLLNASRKYVYAWLDHFDAVGFTYRVENLRYIRGK